MLDQKANLKGKNAVIIGGASGIGRAVTLGLATEGVNVAFCDKNTQALPETSAEAEKLGVKSFAMKADVLSAEEISAFYDALAKEIDKIDILVNVAGGVRRRDFATSTDEEDARDIRRNYGYVIQSIRAALPMMDRGSSIINFTTIESQRGAATFSVYAGAKAATANLTRALAVELGPRGIRVNEITPDTTQSQGNYEAIKEGIDAGIFDAPPEISAKSMALYIPLGTQPTQEQLADAVVFLASDLASAISGVALAVDGGTGAAKGFLNWPHGQGWLPTASGKAATQMFAED